MSDKERKLIRRIKKGNQHAFQTLYNRYVNDAIRTVYGITRNHNHTFDIVQETFIKVYRHLEKFDEEKPFKPWFHRILLNESMRYSKKEAKSGIPTTDETIDYLVSSRQAKTNETLEIALEKLNPDIRTLLVLKYFNAYTEKEIAILLDLPETTVKSRLYKARNELKRCLGGIADEG